MLQHDSDNKLLLSDGGVTRFTQSGLDDGVVSNPVCAMKGRGVGRRMQRQWRQEGHEWGD
jgi:hypothetical protein